MEISGKRSKTNPTLWAIFLDFAKVNPVILTRKFDSANGRQRYDELWKEIAATLNSTGFVQKSVEKGQKDVADWKSKVKGKAADIKKGHKKTGGGRPQPPLNENERRLMAIIGWSVTGINIPVLGFDTESTASVEPSAEQNVDLLFNHEKLPKSLSPPPLRFLNNQDIQMTIETSSEPSKPSPNTVKTSKSMQNICNHEILPKSLSPPPLQFVNNQDEQMTIETSSEPSKPSSNTRPRLRHQIPYKIERP